MNPHDPSDRGNRYGFDGSAEHVTRVVKAFEKEGSLDRASISLGVSPRTMTRWIGRFPQLAEALKTARASRDRLQP